MIRALEIHDVDNRLNDVLDALQGRMGGSKAVRKFEPIILNAGTSRSHFAFTTTVPFLFFSTHPNILALPRAIP
jgi:hypothetical protein